MARAWHLKSRTQGKPTAANFELKAVDLPPLDGIIAANLLHFVRDQAGLIGRLRAALRADGRLLVVEYEQALPIPWVPHPLPFARLQSLARDAGFQPATQIGARRSPRSFRRCS